MLRQRRFISRCGLIAVCLSNREPAASLEPAKTTMGCCRYLSSAVNEALAKTRDVSLRMGACLMRCCVRWCVCSDCLPSAETVSRCLYGIITFAFVTVGCPIFVTWIVCRAIILWRNRKRDENSGPFAGENEALVDNYSDDDHQRVNPDICNYLFYANRLKSEPKGDLINEIHAKWKGNYELLEHHHGFIQWLFPLYESGVNSYAQVLNIDEREMIIEDAAAYRRILESYKLMLDFYGITLLDENTGELARSGNYRERFNNLNRNTHNFLRISRIIKCLEIFNYSHLTVHLVKFFITEIVQEGNLPACRSSCMLYWIPALSEQGADEMRQYVKFLEAEKAVRFKLEEVGILIDPGLDDQDRTDEE